MTVASSHEPFGRNRLTPSERERFERDGYLIYEDALSASVRLGLQELSGRLAAEYYVAAGPVSGRRARRRLRRWTRAFGDIRPVALGESVELQNVVGRPELLDLVDHHLILPKVAGILGWNICVYLASIVVSPPEVDPEPIERHLATGWHQDSSRVNHDLHDDPRPRLSVKVGYFLSDVTTRDCGNMWVVPGSHLANELPDRSATDGLPVQVPPGSAIIFDRRLWHSASPNRSQATRVVVFIGYAHRWLRPHDDMDVAGIWQATTPLRRQLLGYAPDSTSYYSPEDADVPLRSLVEGSG